MTDGDDQVVVERTRRWVDDAVVGLALCPFAGAVVKGGLVRTAVHHVDEAVGAIHAVLTELERLVNADPTAIATTLIVFPEGLADFSELLDVIGAVEELLDESGACEIVQLASFHPDYRFASVPSDDLGNYTNRSPYPVIQLLRIADVAAAVDAHPDPFEIPKVNVAQLRALGRAAIAEIWARFTPV